MDNSFTLNIWITRDGRILKISEMETTHLKHTVAMMRRKGLNQPRVDLMEAIIDVRKTV